MTKYSFIKLDFKQANNLWLETRMKSSFTNPKIIKFLKDYEFEFFGGFYGNDPLLFWPVISSKKKVLIPNNFYYLGPSLTNNFINLKNHSKINKLTQILDLGLNQLSKKYEEILFNTHFSFGDIRPIIWMNRFDINIKYSATINPTENYIDSWRPVRRQELKKIKKIENDIILDDFVLEKEIIELASHTINYSNDKIEKYLNIHFFYEIFKNNFAKIIAIREKQSKKILSFCYLLEDFNSINLIYNFALPDWKNQGVMQLNINEVIKYCKKQKKTLDFNGANSVIGANDKASYGAEEKLYFSFKSKN